MWAAIVHYLNSSNSCSMPPPTIRKSHFILGSMQTLKRWDNVDI